MKTFDFVRSTYTSLTLDVAYAFGNVSVYGRYKLERFRQAPVLGRV